MIADPILPPARVAAMTRNGFWPDRTLLDDLDRAVETGPERIAIVGTRAEGGPTTELTYRDLAERSRRIAAGLRRRGVAPGDVVAMQLPNWWQFTAVHLACLRVGAITNPLMPIFRHRELRFMLSFAEAKLAVVPRRFRGFDFPAMYRELEADVPSLEHVLVVEGEGDEAFEAALLDPDPGPDSADLDALRAGPNDVVELMYTSGTTGAPKGVMHTPNTLYANLLAYVSHLDLTPDETVLMSSPLAHQTGFLYGLMMPIILGTKVVLQDVWSPAEAARHVERERVTFSMASTPFLSDLVHSTAVAERDVSTLRTFVSAGAPIPRVLVEEAAARLDLFVHSGWGMTENGCVTLTGREDPPEKVFGTDGAPLRGMECRVVDDGGDPAAAGAEGDLEVRGASNFVGYLKRPEAFGTDDAGWFATGDRAWMDGDGYIRIVGRSKDIIIRGGENVPVVEVEELLYRHPSVQDAAIVAMPDSRLGERACAFVTVKAGTSLTFEEMIAYLEEQRMATQYLPERLRIIDEMPRTPSGKIQKFRLRDN